MLIFQLPLKGFNFNKNFIHSLKVITNIQVTLVMKLS